MIIAKALSTAVAPPSVVGDPKIVQKGANVNLECTVESSPAPTVHWYKEGVEIKEGDSYKISLQTEAGNKHKLLCEILNFDKKLAAVYKADISNAEGNTAANFTVTAGDAPDFIEKPKIVTRDGGKILGIKVHTKSKVEPTVSWAKDDKPITANDRISITTKKVDDKPGEYLCVLEIKMPQKEDEANYKCTVKNADGQNSQSLRLAFD